jgi:hypothetical protein
VSGADSHAAMTLQLRAGTTRHVRRSATVLQHRQRYFRRRINQPVEKWVFQSTARWFAFGSPSRARADDRNWIRVVNRYDEGDQNGNWLSGRGNGRVDRNRSRTGFRARRRADGGGCHRTV